MLSQETLKKFPRKPNFLKHFIDTSSKGILNCTASKNTTEKLLGLQLYTLRTPKKNLKKGF
jgi:hypothetical protein